MAENKKYNKFGSLQLNADDIMKWNEELPENAFEPASSEEKENFIQDRKSVSYWKDAWRRLRKNTVAMVALGIIILLTIFAFVGPMIVPYTYKQQIRGSEALGSFPLFTGRQAGYSCIYRRTYRYRCALPQMKPLRQARAEAEASGREAFPCRRSKNPCTGICECG